MRFNVIKRPRKRIRSSPTNPRSNKKVKQPDTNDSDQWSDTETVSSVSSDSENSVTDEQPKVCADRFTVTSSAATSSSENNTINSIINSTRFTTDTCTAGPTVVSPVPAAAAVITQPPINNMSTLTRPNDLLVNPESGLSSSQMASTGTVIQETFSQPTWGDNGGGYSQQYQQHISNMPPSKALDDGKEVRAIFCDISKAFDRVWHIGLLYKLRRAGITGSLISWFSHYLHDRKQRVVLPGASSNWSSVQPGVPRGSILGPLLFLLYINDIVEDIQSSITLFADDTSLYIIVDDPLGAAITLNSDLSRIHRWASQWLVTFNPSKSESLLFPRKVNKPYHPPLTMNYEQVTEVTKYKHLGLYFSSKGTWHEHIEYIIKKKAWQRIYIMHRCKFLLDRKSLQTIYFSFIRPLLEYTDVVWSNCTQYEAQEFELIQNEAARIVNGATRLVSINSLLTETEWESLHERRRKHKLIFFFKMKNGLCPEYLSSLIPANVGSPVGYSLRNANAVRTVNAKSQLYFNSFLPSTIREWNELPPAVQNSPTLPIFKNHLNSNLRAPPA